MSPSQGIRDTGALGVLLAGGQGERLGLGVPKALATLGGMTFYERALTALTALCSHVWVSAPVGMTLPKMTATGSRVIRVNDPPGAGGPLAGIAAVAADETFAIESAREGARIVTLAVDLPLVTHTTLRTLLEAYDTRSAGAAALIPAPGGHAQPLAAVWSLPAVEALAHAFARGERSVTRAATTLGARLLDDAALVRLGIADEIARDVDTAADLAAASRWLHDLAREDV
jgi:molybdopterin-guanine dinucleotide biosynthesis protein A